MIGRVLVGLGGRAAENGDCTASATRHALEIAARHQSGLTGVTVADFDRLFRVGTAPIGAASAIAELREHRVEVMRERVNRAIAEFENQCAKQALPYTVLREERAEPFDYLISQARYHDLTVIGLKGLFEFGVTGEAHYDPASIMVRLIEGGVRPILAAAPEYRPIERVLVAYSGSPQSAKTMRRFVQMDLWPNAKVRIVAFGKDRERRERHLEHATEYFAAHGIEAEREYRETPAKSGVLEVADDWDADLIVMGNSHRTLLARKMLGDTMLETVRKSDRALFLSQ